MTKDVVLYDFKQKSYKPVATWEGEDRNPVFAPSGDAFYFLSEREGTMNIFKQPLKGGDADAVALTRFETHPVRFLSVAQNGTLCFGYDGEIYTLKEGQEPQKLSIQILNDVDEDEVIRPPLPVVSPLPLSPLTARCSPISFVVRCL